MDSSINVQRFSRRQLVVVGGAAALFVASRLSPVMASAVTGAEELDQVSAAGYRTADGTLIVLANQDGTQIASLLANDGKIQPVLGIAPTPGWRTSHVLQAGTSTVAGGTYEEQGAIEYDVGSMGEVPVELQEHPLISSMGTRISSPTTRMRPWLAIARGGRVIVVSDDLPDGFLQEVVADEAVGLLKLVVAGSTLAELERAEVSLETGAVVSRSHIGSDVGAETGKWSRVGELALNATVGELTLFRYEQGRVRHLRTVHKHVDGAILRRSRRRQSPIIIGLATEQPFNNSQKSQSIESEDAILVIPARSGFIQPILNDDFRALTRGLAGLRQSVPIDEIETIEVL